MYFWCQLGIHQLEVGDSDVEVAGFRFHNLCYATGGLGSLSLLGISRSGIQLTNYEWVMQIHINSQAPPKPRHEYCHNDTISCLSYCESYCDNLTHIIVSETDDNIMWANDNTCRACEWNGVPYNLF